MLVGYEGRIVDGRPTFIESVVLPENTKIIVMVEMPQKNVKKIPQASDGELSKRREMLKSITGIIATDVDVNATRAERIAKRGLSE